MSTIFYDHLINWQQLEDALDALELDREDRLEIWEHSEHIIHTEIIMVLVSHLPVEKHEEFIELFHAAPHDQKHWDFIKTHGHGDVIASVKQKGTEIINRILQEFSPRP